MSSFSSARTTFAFLLAALAVGPALIPAVTSAEVPAGSATASSPGAAPAAAADVRFPATIATEISGKPAQLRLTGTAFRKALGIKFYEIGGYCCTTQSPRDVDALAAADVPKQLILVLERDISENILRRSFEAAFSANDPQGQFTAQTKTLLDHLAAGPLKKGDRITLTHLPATGVECRLGDAPAIRVPEPAFAHVVWNVYMGPKGVCPRLREGLGTQLSTAAID